MEVSNIFSNFTEETCTGTGATLALAGATTGNIQFGKSYADGDPVAYIVEDSGGTIKVAGVGTYVSATDDITRNDTWNWNGTVIDNNPSTNITLSGGTHTVRCDVVKSMLRPASQSSIAPTIVCMDASQDNTFTGFAANTFYAAAFELRTKYTIIELGFNIDAAAASSFTRVGLYNMGSDGLPSNLIIESGAVDTSTTGQKTTTITSTTLDPGFYYAAMLSDGAIDPAAGSGSSHTVQVLGGSANTVVSKILVSGSLTYGALPAIAPTVTYNTSNSPPLVWMNK